MRALYLAEADTPGGLRERLQTPLAIPVYGGLRDFYESPYELMPRMGKGVQLHMVAGLLLIVGYVVAVVAGHLSHSPPFFLR